MPLWKIAWRSIQHRSLASGLTAFSMGLGVALVVAVIVIYGVLNQTFMRSAQGYDMVIGQPKGSPLDLVLGAVFYSGYLSDTIPYDYFRQLETGPYSPEVETAIPIALGDHIFGMPVIATSPKFFTELRYLDRYSYSFRHGKNMDAGGDFEAVLGYAAAQKAKLHVGDKFKATISKHVPSKEFPEPDMFTVVGILDPTGTPNDQAFFVNLEGFFIMNDHADRTAIDKVLTRKSTDRGISDEATFPETTATTTATTAGTEQKNEPQTESKSEQKNEPKTTKRADRRISAILVLTKVKEVAPTIIKDSISGMEKVQIDRLTAQKFDPVTMSLANRLVADLDVQVAKPTYEITRLFEMIVGRIQTVLIIFAIMVIIVAAIGMMVSIYNSMNERRQEIAIMRALGAKRGTVMSIILLESILLSLGGGLIGMVIGHGLIAGVGPIIAQAVMVIVNPWHFQFAELILIPGLILLASLVGYLPAVVAYRTDVAQSLNP
ncbi:MAG: ABC transporter permease [Planctomycetaceae bacterium]|jgi:putative ABC transport system permease protein|nr:ABC transporter permease [Planctomycetaceae bacterium]